MTGIDTDKVGWSPRCSQNRCALLHSSRPCLISPGEHLHRRPYRPEGEADQDPASHVHAVGVQQRPQAESLGLLQARDFPGKRDGCFGLIKSLPPILEHRFIVTCCSGWSSDVEICGQNSILRPTASLKRAEKDWTSRRSKHESRS